MNITANLIVDAIEPQLEFWMGRLGYQKIVEVPEGDRLGFVILEKAGASLMLQSRASLASDIAPAAGSYRTFLYIHVKELAPVRQALEGVPLLVPERRTFYGADEIIVNDPAGNVIVFAFRPEPEESQDR